MPTATFNPTGKYLIVNNTSPGGGTNFNTQRTLSDAVSANNLGSVAFHNCREDSSSWYLITRVFLWFDTSTLPDNAVISSAKLVFPAVNSTSSDNTLGFGFTTHTAASTPTTADWDSCTINSPTEFTTRIALTSLSTSGTTDVALNANGLSAISKSASTPILLRGSLDIDNSAPVNLNEPTFDYSAFVLSVTYTSEGGSFLLNFV